MAPRFSTLSLVMSLSAALSAFGGPPALAQMASSDPMVGGAAMYPSRTIVENAVNSRDHTTLVAAVKAAGLVGTLSGRGPFTVFAPTNEAFARLPTGTVEMLLRPANKPELVKVLTYHVVAGRHSAQDLMGMAASGRSLTTVEGEPLKVMNDGGKIVLVDAHGGRSTVTIADVFQSNGVIQVVDAVLMP